MARYLGFGLCGLLIAGAGVAFGEPDRRCIGSVCVEVVHEEPTVYFRVVNPTAAPITATIRFDTLRNLNAYPVLPPQRTVAPRSAAKLAQFVIGTPYSGWEYRYRWGWVLGDTTAVHDGGTRYRMPFGGTQSSTLSQGVNGTYSHRPPHNYAFDFAMPIGTPILAARSGHVIRVSDGYTRHGISDDFLLKANSILIMHKDRTIATYAHLDPGAGVRAGMRVKVGDVIGFSGNTGFSTGPHLHFEVWKPTLEGAVRTLPIRFHDGTRNGMVPRVHLSYVPGCHSEGRRCAPGELPERNRGLPASHVERSDDGTCRCANGSIITTHLPCRMVCPLR